MKNQLTALALITATALTFAPKPAQADDRGLAIVGGFIGGLIVASAINDSYHDPYAYAAPVGAPVLVAGYDNRGYDGCWQDVSVNVWVPASWVSERTYQGQCIRRFVGGHYERRTNRVWVSRDRDDRRYDRDDRGHDRDDRGYDRDDRGYDRHNRDHDRR